MGRVINFYCPRVSDRAATCKSLCTCRHSGAQQFSTRAYVRVHTHTLPPSPQTYTGGLSSGCTVESSEKLSRGQVRGPYPSPAQPTLGAGCSPGTWFLKSSLYGVASSLLGTIRLQLKFLLLSLILRLMVLIAP